MFEKTVEKLRQKQSDRVIEKHERQIRHIGTILFEEIRFGALANKVYERTGSCTITQHIPDAPPHISDEAYMDRVGYDAVNKVDRWLGCKGLIRYMEDESRELTAQRNASDDHASGLRVQFEQMSDVKTAREQANPYGHLGLRA